MEHLAIVAIFMAMVAVIAGTRADGKPSLVPLSPGEVESCPECRHYDATKIRPAFDNTHRNLWRRCDISLAVGRDFCSLDVELRVCPPPGGGVKLSSPN